MQKAKLPSADKKLAKPKATLTSTCKKKNDTLQPNENAAKAAAAESKGRAFSTWIDKEVHDSMLERSRKYVSKDIALSEINSFLYHFIEMHLDLGTLKTAVRDGSVPASVIPYPAAAGHYKLALYYDQKKKGVRYELHIGVTTESGNSQFTVDYKNDIEHAFNVFLGAMQEEEFWQGPYFWQDSERGDGEQHFILTYGAVINQFCHNMHAGVEAVEKAFNDNTDEYIINTAPGSTDGIYVGQTWRLKTDAGPCVVVRVENGDVFYCFGHETGTFTRVGFDEEMTDRKDIQTFTRHFCSKLADPADVMRRGASTEASWPIHVSKPSAATKK